MAQNFERAAIVELLANAVDKVTSAEAPWPLVSASHALGCVA